MKAIKLTLIIMLCYSTIGFCQQKTHDHKSYVQIREIDSSGYFITGEYPNKKNRTKYNFLTRNQFEYSSMQTLFWTNALIINSDNGKTTKLFSNGLVAVYPLYNTVALNKYDWSYNPAEKSNSSGMSENYLIFLVRSDELNKDGILDEEDPVSIYISNKTGTAMKRITEPSMNVTSWVLSKDCNRIISTIQTDSNSDKKFSDGDEELYYINLDEDMSKIILLKAVN